MITDQTLAIWKEAARRDNWHIVFVASDIREMIGEIERLRARLKTAEANMDEQR
jgi:hypothetical protein